MSLRRREAPELLEAGAVLPLGTRGAGEQAVPLTARAYRHPGLEDRVVVRLAAAELGPVEDACAGFFGLEPAGDPQVVGLGRREPPGFPAWALVHHPEDGHHALAVVPELERAARQAGHRPKAALADFQGLAGRLAGSVPHLLPTFYERAGREFLAAGHLAFAGRMFAQARRAEAEHGLPVDEDRLDAAFLEFALAGALPVKTLSGYSKELAARMPVAEALRRFTRLCVRRTAGGLPPSAQMATDVRRLAEAAGAGAEDAEGDYLAEMLLLPATMRVGAGWWKAHRDALLALAGTRPDIRGALLNLMPEGEGEELPGLWLEILEGSGATAALLDPDPEPEEARSKDGAVGWLRRFLELWTPATSPTCHLPALHPLVERMAARLRAELAERGEVFAVPRSVDLLDQLLALEVPVADPGRGYGLEFFREEPGPRRRDLVALAADRRFRAAFDRGADRLLKKGAPGADALRSLAAVRGGRLLLAEWVEGLARAPLAEGLPGLHGALTRICSLPDEVLLLAEDAVRATGSADLVSHLRRTLEAGLFDELSWPAWEEALAALAPPEKFWSLTVSDAWPYLVVNNGLQARVIGAEGTVLVHDLRVPDGDADELVGCHYVDGELLVHWRSRWGRRLLGYWSSAPDRILPLEGDCVWGERLNRHPDDHQVSLPLAGGGRTTGAGVLRRGDTVLPDSGNVIGDGTAYWVWRWSQHGGHGGWYEYDTATGRCGEPNTPSFFTEVTGDLREGFRFGRLLPLASEGPTAVGTPVDGVLGWRAVRMPDGSERGEDLAGNTVVAPENRPPTGLLFFPGDDRPRGLMWFPGQVELIGPDGVFTAFARRDQAPGVFAEGTPFLPPTRYWHCLRPRDPRGSEALRRVGHATAAALLKAAEAGDDLPGAVRSLLPGVTHDALVRGVAGAVRHAASRRGEPEMVTGRLKQTWADHSSEETSDPSDQLIKEGLRGLMPTAYSVWVGTDDKTRLFDQLRILARGRDGGLMPDDPRQRPAIHLDGPGLPGSVIDLVSLVGFRSAAAYCAVSPLTGARQRAAVRRLLLRLTELDLIGDGDRPTRWHPVRLYLDSLDFDKFRDGNREGVLPLKDGALLAFWDYSWHDDSIEFTGLFHDPSCRFEVPAPYREEEREPGWEPGLSAAALTRLLDREAAHGPAPWFPEAAEEFARLTGVTSTMARMVVAGMPGLGVEGRSFLTAGQRALLGVKAVDAAVARDLLAALDQEVRGAVLGALLPEDPARLWTDGPDAAAAAEAWNARVPRRPRVPEWLVREASVKVVTRWEPGRERVDMWGTSDALPALLDLAAAPELSRDLTWKMDERAVPEEDSPGFTAQVLVGAVALTAWLAHRLPAGDTIRAALPAVLAAVRDRLASPGLLLDLGPGADFRNFRRTAGRPAEVGDGFERYGAVLLPPPGYRSRPALKPALLDPTADDLYLAVLRGDPGFAFPAELALRVARDERFAALLAGPGDPVAGERGEDGTWWPQDPSRSVPDLVAEAAELLGLGTDAAAVHLMLLAMPDPTDGATARWTGWRPARMKAARAELAATDLVVEAKRARAGRSLFLPGGWTALKAPHVPLEEWKLPLYGGLVHGGSARVPLGVVVPSEPAADLYRRAWQRVREGDVPRFAELRVPRARRGRRSGVR